MPNLEPAEVRSSIESDDSDSAPVRLPPGSDLIELEDGLVIIAIPIAPPRLPPSLTPAERDIVMRVCDGQSNAEIARQRGVSVSTVANQLGEIYRKVGVGSRGELIVAIDVAYGQVGRRLD